MARDGKPGCLSRIFKAFSYCCVAIVILAFIGSVNKHSSEDTAAQDEPNVRVEQTTSAEKKPSADENAKAYENAEAHKHTKANKYAEADGNA